MLNHFYSILTAIPNMSMDLLVTEILDFELMDRRYDLRIYVAAGKNKSQTEILKSTQGQNICIGMFFSGIGTNNVVNSYYSLQDVGLFKL